MQQTLTKPTAPAYRRAPDQKQNLILEAARELFIEQGYGATSTAQIARHAGVSEGILFHHFGSKKNLFLRVAEELAEAAAAATMPDDATIVTEEFVVRAAFDFADNNPALYQMVQSAGAELDVMVTSAQNDIIIASIADNLARGIARGEVRPGNPRIMAELQFAVVDAAYRAWRKTNQPELREEYISEAIDCMQAMLRNPHE